MADNMAEDELQWFSAELRILEAEYEQSKLRVFQDTLLCKRYMVELELLCKNEQLRKNARVNNKIKKHESQLQEQLESLSTELENATSQLKVAQSTLQDEKAHHDLEKKELEDKLNSEMEKKMDEHRERASHRENLLQEQIKNWQDKHVKTSKEAEDLRTELSMKNVPVKTKAIQTRVAVEDAATMALADPQTSDVGVQVQELAGEVSRTNSEDAQKFDVVVGETKKSDKEREAAPEEMALAGEGSQANGEDVRAIDDVVRETTKFGKGTEGVLEVKQKNKNKKKVKNGEAETDKQRNDKSDKKGKGANKGSRGKENEVDDEEETESERTKASRKRRSGATQQERAGAPNDTTTTAGTQGELHERTNVGNAWLAFCASQDGDVPLQYSRTPRLRKNSEDSNQSLEKKPSSEKSDISTCTSETPISAAEASTSKKQTKEFPQLAVCVENTGNKQLVKSIEVEREGEFHEGDAKDDKDGSAKKSSEQQTEEEQQSHVLMREDKGFESPNECHMETIEGREEEEDEKIVADSKRVNSVEDLQHEEPKGVQNVKKKKRRIKAKVKKENKRTKKTKEVKSTEGKVSQEDSSVKEKNEDEGNENNSGRILRSRAKKLKSGGETDPFKGKVDDRNSKSFDEEFETRQNPHDSHETTETTKEYKTGDDAYLKGHEPAMLLASSPDVDHPVRESELSSREMDPLVDGLRPGVTSRAAVDETTQQPETEVQGELNERECNNKAALGAERLKDYKSDQGSSVLNHNPISEVGEKINRGCLHRVLEEAKSGKSSSGKNDKKKTNLAEGKNNKTDLSSKKCRKSKQTKREVQDGNDASASKRQDSDAIELDNNICPTSKEAKSTSSGTGQPKTKRPKHTATQPVTLKENAPNGKTRGKKRKPTSSVREVLASADQQSSSDATTSIEISSMLDNTKKRKTLFNSRENSLMIPNATVQMSFVNTTLSKSRANAGIPPSLSAFMRSFIAPKLKKSH